MENVVLMESIFESSVNRDENQNLYIKGAFMKAEYRNKNGRVYPKPVLEKEVKRLKESMEEGVPLLGELDHPENSTDITLRNVSHQVVEMDWVGNDVHGKAKVLSTPNGNILKGLLEGGVNVGVSSRATGNVNEQNGQVSNLHILTPCDIVASPSFGTYPESIYEAIQRYSRTNSLNDLSEAIKYDKSAQRHFKKEMNKFIEELFN